MKRRHVLFAAAAALGTRPGLAANALPPIEVYKNPSCGCCMAWVAHLEAAGFPVHAQDTDDTTPIRTRHGLPDRYKGCHTGVVAGYIVEGHVPAEAVKRLLAARPSAIGLAVPGMPVGSPGMESGGRKDPYDVLLIDRQGRATVYESHR